MYVRRIYDILELSLSQSQLIQFPLIRYYHYLIIDITAYIHHRHLFLLFKTLAYHVLREAAHLIERLFSILYRGHIYVEGRNICGAGLQHLRTVYIRKRRHTPVNLLVHLHKHIVHIRAVAECQSDCAGAVSGLGSYLFHSVHLHQLLAQCLYDAFIHLACRHLRRNRLDGYIRDIHIRNQRYRQKSRAHNSEHDHHQHHHSHGNRSVQQGLQHSLTSLTVPSIRLQG